MTVSTNTRSEKAFHVFGVLLSSAAVLILLTLLINIFIEGVGRLSPAFLTSPPSRFAEKAGIGPALAGTIALMVLTALFSLPIGVGAAVYLEEYAPKNRLTRIIELNVANLSGVPSIIYGILGLEIFVRFFRLERSLIAGALTMSLLVMPVIILASREALLRVPNTVREAAYALGATRWDMIRDQVLPMAAPGILTGCILAFSRAIGETAPLVTLGALTYVAFLPDSIFSAFTALPIQAFNWISRPQAAFHQNAAATIVVLLSVLLCMNAIAALLRAKLEGRYREF